VLTDTPVQIGALAKGELSKLFAVEMHRMGIGNESEDLVLLPAAPIG
jgi:hypothetical protein